eukprot:jgi/Hompol1/1331/HPOL_002681-RA
MRQLASKYENKIVLIVGSDSCKNVAISYGFKRPVLCDELVMWNPSMCPFRHINDIKVKIDATDFQISAVLVFNDSQDWGRDMQIIIDLMRSKDGMIGTESGKGEPQSLPLYFSNSDFIWSNDFPVNRFAQGAFRLALETLYEELSGGQRLAYTKYGKPEHATYKYVAIVWCIIVLAVTWLVISYLNYRFATERLHEYAKKLWPEEQLPCRTVYAVGDNPASDIHGANKHGWESILVRTGVWRESHGHNHGAGFVVHHVEEAVHLALQREGI